MSARKSCREARLLLPEDDLERLHHLADTGRGAGIQCGLDDGLAGARLPAEGSLQGRISTQSGVDFRQPVRAGEERNQSILQFVERIVPDLLLRDPHFLFDGRE